MLSEYFKRNVFLEDLMLHEHVLSFVVIVPDSGTLLLNPAAQAIFSLKGREHELIELETGECHLHDQLHELIENICKSTFGKQEFRTSELNGDGFNLRVKYRMDKIEGLTETRLSLLFIEKVPSTPLELARLERVNQELKDYARILSHDLRAPLRGIHSLAEWIKEDNKDQLNEESNEHIDLLLERVDYMDQLINGILTYSKLDIQDQKEKVDLNLTLEKVINSIDKPQNAKIECISPLPTLFVNRTHMLQLFQNLVSNAVKYNDKSQIEITISCQEKEDLFQFKIADNGKGIADRYFGKIFDKFENLDDKMKSSGLGLSIVKKIVHLYGGSIWLESEIGKGSKFHFTLAKN